MNKAIRYMIGFGLGVIVVTGVYGCATPAGAENNGQTIDYYEYQIRTLPDGRKMECLVHESGVGYAVTCNWEGAKKL